MLFRFLWTPVVAIAIGCAGSAPRPLAIGEDDCGYCRMQITDARFGGEIVTSKGKIDTFDSIECLASYFLAQPDTTGMQLFVSDFVHPGPLIPVSSAVFRHGAAGATPMGQGWTATAAVTQTDTDAVRWNAVLDQIGTANNVERATDSSNFGRVP